MDLSLVKPEQCDDAEKAMAKIKFRERLVNALAPESLR